MAVILVAAGTYALRRVHISGSEATFGANRPTVWLEIVSAKATWNGLFQLRWVTEATTFEDGDVLDIPGKPVVIHMPGHSFRGMDLTGSARWTKRSRLLIDRNKEIENDKSGDTQQPPVP